MCIYDTYVFLHVNRDLFAIESIPRTLTAVVEHVLTGRRGQLFSPAKLSTATLVRGLPSWLQERLRDKMAFVLDRPLATEP